MQLVPYINYPGNATEAIELYSQALQGKVTELHLYNQFPDMCKNLPDNWHSKVGHAVFVADEVTFMLADVIEDETHPCGTPKIEYKGCPIALSLNFTDVARQQRVFDAFAQDARKIIMPLEDTFWGARFGILIDKFGIRWMFNFDYPQTKKDAS